MRLQTQRLSCSVASHPRHVTRRQMGQPSNYARDIDTMRCPVSYCFPKVAFAAEALLVVASLFILACGTIVHPGRCCPDPEPNSDPTMPTVTARPPCARTHPDANFLLMCTGSPSPFGCTAKRSLSPVEDASEKRSCTEASQRDLRANPSNGRTKRFGPLVSPEQKCVW